MNRGIVIVVTGEEVIRETLDRIKEVSVDGIRIGGEIEGIGTVIWSRVICPKGFNDLFLLLSPSKSCGVG